jgi:hypothetical protein
MLIVRVRTWPIVIKWGRGSKEIEGGGGKLSSVNLTYRDNCKKHTVYDPKPLASKKRVETPIT